MKSLACSAFFICESKEWIMHEIDAMFDYLKKQGSLV